MFDLVVTTLWGLAVIVVFYSAVAAIGWVMYRAASGARWAKAACWLGAAAVVLGCAVVLGSMIASWR